MSWKPVWKVAGEGDKWCKNAQVFATEEEAMNSARRRFQVWSACYDYNVLESNDKVNYRWDNEKGDVHIGDEK
jgi:hypothetical protein